MKMKRIISLMLALVLVLSLAACKASNTENTKPTENTNPKTETEETQDKTQNDPAEVKPVVYFSMNLNKSANEMAYLSAYPVDDATVYIEYMGAERKRGEAEVAVMEAIATKLVAANLAALNERAEYGEGEAVGGLYVEFADGSTISADFSGEIPKEFIEAYDAMDACFLEITADMPVYVPQPVLMGEVNAEVLAQMQAILAGSGIQMLDNFSISDVPTDENFSFVMGLSSSEGIVNGTSCGGMMMTTAYSLNIVTVENEADIQKVREDFQKSMDWTKWVCVMPTDALIAQKGNMVLCLMGADDLFTGTQAGIVANGWENIVTFKQGSN